LTSNNLYKEYFHWMRKHNNSINER
jgi:hypothetical protein